MSTVLYLHAAELASLLKTLKPFTATGRLAKQRPILGFVRVCENGQIIATDIDAFVLHDAPDWKDEDGRQAIGFRSFLLPLEPVAAWLRTIRKTAAVRIEVDQSKGMLMLHADDSRSFFPTMPDDDFPAYPRRQFASVCDIYNGSLSDALKNVEFATDSESTRFALGAVLLDLGTESFAIATDGRRMAKFELSRDVNYFDQTSRELLFPAKYAKPAAALLGSDVMLSREDTDTADMISLISDRCEIILRLVSGRFPRWRDVFSMKQHQYVATFSAKDLARTLKTIKQEPESRGADFVFHTAVGHLEVSNQLSYGRAKPVRFDHSYDGRTLDCSLDFQYVREFVSNVDGEIDIAFQDSDSAVYLLADRFSYVVMPLAGHRCRTEHPANVKSEETEPVAA